jgi:hypothetical protein
MEWKETTVELPDFHKPILFYVDNGLGVMSGMFYKSSHKFISYGKYTEATFYKAEVTHWMYMPEAPAQK